MPRSGTNLVRRIVGSHSNIAIPTAEFHFFKGHVQNRSVRQILANERLRSWGVDFSDLYEKAPSHVYVTVLRRYADKKGKAIIGEKSPGNEFYLNVAEGWLSDFDVKCLVMMRNPLDVAASIKFIPSAQGKNENDPRLVPRTAREWCRSVTIGLARAYAQPRNFRVVRYEDLVADPNGCTQGLCEFLGVDFQENRMLSLADFSDHKDNSSFAEQDKIQQAYRIYRPSSRQQYLSNEEISAVREICGELAWAAGYTDANLLPTSEMAFPQAASDLGLVKAKLSRWSKHLLSLSKNS